ncbi:MAG: hypothetical protein BWY91_03051 [bacterium ADurb.BinA028]|nr:MAG: hypothetical protein BWY91_03051 [bacterium ADurb.BinA028]
MHGIPVEVGRRVGGDDTRVAEGARGAALRVPVFAGDPAHREAVAPVGSDVELEDLLTQAEERQSVIPRRQACRHRLTEVVGQHDDPRVVLAEAQLILGADHPVGDPAIGLARRDGEPARQDGAGQHHHDEVTDLEVRCAANDLLRDAIGDALPVVAHIDRAEPDRLAVLLDLLVEGQDAPDHQRARDVAAVQRLLLETDRDERRGDLGAASTGSEIDELAEPGQGNPHVTPPSRTDRRIARRPRPCRACHSRRCAVAGRARYRSRTRSPCRHRGRSRTPRTPCG